MTEITIEIYGNEAEITSFKPGSCELSIKFSTPIEGYLSISDKAFVISNGKCIFKTNALPDGELKLQLITKTGILVLPSLVKDGKMISPRPYGDEFTRRLSQRERELEKRVKELENEVSRLIKSVYGTKLFE